MDGIAFLCVYGNQDFYRIVGRDPTEQPMTALERAILARCVYEHKRAEFTPRESTGSHE